MPQKPTCSIRQTSGRVFSTVYRPDSGTPCENAAGQALCTRRRAPEHPPGEDSHRRTSYGAVHASLAGASKRDRPTTELGQRWEGFRSDTTDTTAVQLRWLVSLKSLHTPLLGICSGQRPDESDQHGDASLNLPAHSRRTSTMAVRQTHLRWSQACGRWLLRPTYALCFGYPHRVHEEAPNRRFRRSGALRARGGR